MTSVQHAVIPKLVVLEGSSRGTIMPLRKGKNRIGRDPTIELILPDALISRQHAVIECNEDGSVLSDLNSTNATYVNGLRITRSCRLTHGDELMLGKTHLIFLSEGVEAELVDQDELPQALAVGLDETTKLVESEPSSAVSALNIQRVRPRCLVGNSQSLRDVSDMIARCAPLASTVLVVGESGTGKELVAEALHRQGTRRSKPFVVVNCATLEPTLLESELFGHERGAFTGAVARRLGKLELAGAGTLFLDEVGELPPQAQAKLLRAIDTRCFERLGGSRMLETRARFVAATHCDLEAMVREGSFREDLLFRLKVIEIPLEPLRKRVEDIVPIIDHFLSDLRRTIPAKARAFTREAIDLLKSYPYPGNVRELRNIVERCLIFCEKEYIDFSDLPPEVRGGSDPEGGADSGQLLTLEESERRQIQRALSRTSGNKTQAAKLLGIDRVTLYSKLKRHAIG